MASVSTTVKVDVAQGLYSDLKKFATNYAKGMALEVKRILTDEAKTALDIFYGDYSPMVYSRTNNLHDNSYEPYYSNAHGSIIRGGVKFSPDNMDEVYRAPASWVFSLGVGSGIHRLPGQGLSVTNPTPINYVEQKRDNLAGLTGMLSGAGESLARSDSYTYLTVN